MQVRPDLRFAPRTLNTVALATKDLDMSRGYRVDWCPSGGGACVDGRLLDATRVSTHDAPSGLLVRRVKHCSGYTVVADRAAAF
ncbi:MAG: hypothetical protein AVDCRST_MAG40-1485 [uncultured Gemmatimonadaceae bacterium]|uniref:Uncharacterized protein n=1 Tax=uncultured Gemmatimonadaceae bacterium TaxID=246130 RepID=A0A6J4L3Q0_9BACT|nr:MAG: hypothetical protein AVDCRST_MAG40-1485 [uncultured Gemmatimonadaceae bacterium]